MSPELSELLNWEGGMMEGEGLRVLSEAEVGILLQRLAQAAGSEPVTEVGRIIIPSTSAQSVEIVSPTVQIIRDVLLQKVGLPDLHWRQFEELIADLLSRDGFEVTLGPGQKDSGIDILARRKDPVLGDILSIWQAKRFKGRPVGVEHIRELAYTTGKFHASKGMLATTTRLTKDAIGEIEILGSMVGKKDHDEVLAWMKRAYGLSPHLGPQTHPSQ